MVEAECPTPGPAPKDAKPKLGSLTVIPSADPGAYGASALCICDIAMKTGAYWVGFVCSYAFIIGVCTASFSAPY